jgi:hypothetical protein
MNASTIFLNYRRDDTGATLARLAERLEAKLGKGHVFYDREALSGGDRWKERLRDEITRCSVFLALIGKDWLRARDPDSGQRRLDDPDDPVRFEIEIALEHARTRGLLLAPVLIDQAQVPSTRSKLPTLQDLFEWQLFRLRTATNAEWDADVEMLLATLEGKGVLAGTPPSQGPAPAWLEAHLHETIARFQRHMTTSGLPQAGQGRDSYLELMVVERREEGGDKSKAERQERKSVPLQQIVAGMLKPTLILGEGGAGKTTSMLSLAARMADRARSDTSVPIPIYANLAHLTKIDDVLDLQRLLLDAVSPASSWEEVTSTAREADRRFLFLFDSFNEVPELLQRNCTLALARFVQKQGERHSCLIASRAVPQVQPLTASSAGFTTYELLRLADEQARDFLTRRGLGALHARMTGELRELARNPFMLQAIARTLAGVKEEELPRNRGQLYHSFVRGWMENEEGKRRPQRYSFERVKQPLLCHLAKRMTAAGQTSLAANGHLDQDVERQLRRTYRNVRRKGGMPADWSVDQCLAELLDDGLLQRLGSQLHFMHQSVQEYFTGLHFADSEPDALAAFTPTLAWASVEPWSLVSPPNHRLVPALRMMVGLIEDATRIVEALAASHPILAAAVIPSAARVQRALHAKLERAWLRLLDDADPHRRAVGCSCLALAGMVSSEVVARLVRAAFDTESRTASAAEALRALAAPEAIALELARQAMQMDAEEYKIAKTAQTLKDLQSPHLAAALLVHWRRARADAQARLRAERLLATLDASVRNSVLEAPQCIEPEAIGDARAALDAAAAAEPYAVILSISRFRRIRKEAEQRHQQRATQELARLARVPDLREVVTAGLVSDDAAVRSAAARLVLEQRIPVEDALLAAILRRNQGWASADLTAALLGLCGEAATLSKLREQTRIRRASLGALAREVMAALRPTASADEVISVLRPELARLGVDGEVRLEGVTSENDHRLWIFVDRNSEQYELWQRDLQGELFDCNIAKRAVRALVDVPGAAAASELYLALEHSDPRIQALAVSLLSERKSEALSARLLSMLRSKSTREFVSNALAAVRRSPLPAALFLLEDLLIMTRDEFSDVHPLWGPSRSQPGWSDQIHSILVALEVDDKVRDELAQALRSETPARRAAALSEWRRWLEQKDVPPARADAWRSPQRIAQILQLALHDASEDVRGAAIANLAHAKAEIEAQVSSTLDAPEIASKLAAAEILIGLDASKPHPQLAAQMFELARSAIDLPLRRRAAAVLAKMPDGLNAFYEPIQNAWDNWPRALRLVEEAQIVVPDDLNLHWWRSHVLRGLGRLSEATDSLERAAQLEGGLSIIPQALAEIFLELEEYARAFAAAESGARIAPYDAGCQAALAWSAFFSGDLDAARAAADQALALDPVLMDGIFGALVIQVKRGDLPAAQATLEHGQRVQRLLSPTLDPALAALVHRAIAAGPEHEAFAGALLAGQARPAIPGGSGTARA